MNPLSRLATLLEKSAELGALPMSSDQTIDIVIAEMQTRNKRPANAIITIDQQLVAVKRFWETQQIEFFRDVYLLSWALCIPHRPSGLCILEDQKRLELVLENADTWISRPSAYRRCYQGLIKNYFNYVPTSEDGKVHAQSNWGMFRDYLRDRITHIKQESLSPGWVKIATDNLQLFSKNPYDPYVDTLLQGDTSIIENLCEQLLIGKASWFLDRLVMAQVRKAILLADTEFVQLLPRLLDILRENEILRDLGLRLLLNRYVIVVGAKLHQQLRDLTVYWWGNPWLPSNETRWGSVEPAARAMVADWLKLEFIEDFFTKLAQDGVGDPRRMNFWKRYVKAIDHIDFALGSNARNSRDADYVALRKKMNGLISELDAPGTNNAFIMRIGRLVVVEFSDPGNALYGYDAQKTVPFDTGRVLRLPVGVANSLKQKSKAVFWQGHRGGPSDWNRWELLVEEKLRTEFGINPGSLNPYRQKSEHQLHSTPSSHAINSHSQKHGSSVYSLQALEEFAKAHKFQIQDNRNAGGNLWILADFIDQEVSEILIEWGFSHKPGKGWWK